MKEWQNEANDASVLMACAVCMDYVSKVFVAFAVLKDPMIFYIERYIDQ